MCAEYAIDVEAALDVLHFSSRAYGWMEMLSVPSWREEFNKYIKNIHILQINRDERYIFLRDERDMLFLSGGMRYAFNVFEKPPSHHIFRDFFFYFFLNLNHMQLCKVRQYI